MTSDFADIPIQIADVSKSYEGAPVLRDITFQVERGQVCGLVGPNGAGKSTLLRILLGLAEPDAGQAIIAGVPYAELDRPGRTVGVVLDGSGVAPHDSARRHLRRLARYLDVPKQRVEEVLVRVDLADAADRRSGRYSLGMTQRLALACALLGDPDILVLDEPANGLDPAGLRWLRESIQAFAMSGGTVLVSSHQLEDLQQVADNFVILDKTVRFAGSRAELGIDEQRAGALEETFFQLVGDAR